MKISRSMSWFVVAVLALSPATQLLAEEDVLVGDVNQDGTVNLLDVQPFVDLISSGEFQPEADCNYDGTVNLLDVDRFIAILSAESESKGCDFEFGDVNQDGWVNLLDVEPFVDRLMTDGFQCEADINQDGVVNLLDVEPFIDLLTE